MGFHFGTVYVREVSLSKLSRALEDLMAENDRLPTGERGLEPTPDECTEAKRVRSFALLPEEDGWSAVLEDNHPLDDGGVAEGLSDLLQVETLHLVYSDDDASWSYTRYWEGQPLEAGGTDDEDYDVSAMEFVQSQALPYFGVYYEEVAATADVAAPALASSLVLSGDLNVHLPLGTEIRTFMRRPRQKPN